MKQIKTTRNSSKGQDKSTDNNWKSKAKIRGAENMSLRKRIKELTESRDAWKKKYKTEQGRGSQGLLIEGSKGSRHQYSLVFVSLILELHKFGGMSLRSCRHSIGCMLISLGLSGRLPSHSTIRNWLCKGGLNGRTYCLCHNKIKKVMVKC